MIPTPHLDRVADIALKALTSGEIETLDDELYALTGIGLSYEGFDDFELVIHDPNPQSERYVCWPIPALQTVREARALAEQLKAAATVSA